RGELRQQDLPGADRRTAVVRHPGDDRRGRHGGAGPRARPQGQVQWLRGPGAVSPHRHPRQPLRPLLCAGRHQACLRRSRGVGQGRTSASPEEGGDGVSGVDIGALLERLGLSLVNPGSWSGSHGWSGSTDVPLLSMHSERPKHRMSEQWHPLGVVGVISAFNFPVAVWSWNACLAAICGNATVWKPSHKTPLSALAVQRLCNRVIEANRLPPIFQLFIDAGTGLATRFVDDRRVALISFTGSTEVGRKVGERVAARLGKSLLELGGNNAIIVDETANLDLAVPAIVFGAVGTAGQRCTSTRRVLVHKAIAAELERRLVHAYRQVRIGDPLEPATLMGPLIDAHAVEAYRSALAAARAAGGELLYGGKVLERSGNFVEPAIVRARNDWPIVQTETFAPILYLIPVASLGEAIGAQNASAHGLSSALFTDRLANAETFLSAGGSDCGIANINLGT